jgi:hypothetical protein
MTKRPHMPMKVKLDACLLRLGLDPDDVEWDHDPALELRAAFLIEQSPWESSLRPIWVTLDGVPHSVLWDSEGVPYYTIPDANDPLYLVPRSKADHRRKTNGPGGTKRITTRGGDHGDAAHLRRLEKKERDFRARLLKQDDQTPRKRKIPSRPMKSRKP